MHEQGFASTAMVLRHPRVLAFEELATLKCVQGVWQGAPEPVQPTKPIC